MHFFCVDKECRIFFIVKFILFIYVTRDDLIQPLHLKIVHYVLVAINCVKGVFG